VRFRRYDIGALPSFFCPWRQRPFPEIKFKKQENVIMGRKPHPFYYKSRKAWYATIHGKPNQKLIEGPNNSKVKQLAYDKFYQLMGQSPSDFSSSKDTVATICELFLEDTQANKSPATYGWFYDLISKFLKYHPRLKVAELKPHHVMKWVSSTPKNSDTTKRNKITAVKRVFKWAKKMGHIDVNPLAELEGVSAGRRDSYVSMEEFKEILTFVRDDNFRDLITVAFSTGMRPTELWRCESRHFKSKVKRFEFPLKESKGKKRTRVVFLPTNAFKIVARRAAKYPSGRLFRNSDDEPWNSSSCGCQFGRLQIRMAKAKMLEQGLKPKTKMTSSQAAKYQKRFCLFDFRHGFAKAAIKTVDSVIVGALMGHKDRSMVAKIYSHLDSEPEFLEAEFKKVKTISAK
jgi:integrase